MFTRYRPIYLSHRLFEATGGSNSKKPPIIFMHGLMERKETWDQIPQRVADATKRKVYTFDARNHGESEHTMESNFENNTYDLYHFMDKMKIDRSILVGHNIGGLTAMRAALQQPSKVETCFIVDMHTDKIPREQIKQYLLYMRSCAARLHHTPEEVPRPNLARVRVPPPMDSLQDEGLFRSVLTFRLLALIDALMEYDRYVRKPCSGRYCEPVYFLYGIKSQYRVQDHISTIHKYFPMAHLIGFEGGSTNLYKEYPDEFVSVLCDRISTDRRSRWF